MRPLPHPTHRPSCFLKQLLRPGMLIAALCSPISAASATDPRASGASSVAVGAQPPFKITMPASQLAKSSIHAERVTRSNFSAEIRLTGRIALNEDRLAHIFPVVEGQVESVQVGLGDAVKEGATLVTVRSREVGNAKLDLFQARLALDLAQLRLRQQEEIARNTGELLKALQQQESISQIQTQFTGRTMGDYRDKLLSSYSSYLKSNADVERLSDVVNSGAVSSKQLAWAKASRDADQATYFSKVEQVDYELKTSLLQAIQQVKEAETRVAVITTNLKIMGCQNSDIVEIDPIQQGEALSNYAMRAPLAGTVIAKDVVLREQVRPDKQIMAIADLSTVWVEANIYEKDLPLLESILGQTIKIRNAAWPNRDFPAKVFYTGEIMEEATRTISLRAIADNPNRLLKPGMFVAIEFSFTDPSGPVLQVPQAAVLEHEGATFVFVQTSDTTFERRDVQCGAKNDASIVIRDGLKEQDRVVISGGFVLKSKMLESLMGEE